MQAYRFSSLFLIVVLLSISLVACSSVQQILQGTPTPTYTNTSTSTPTFTQTSTVTITSTNTPTLTATPNFTETQQYVDFYTLVQGYYDAGYIPSLNGKYYHLEDYSISYDEDGYYLWDIVKVDKYEIQDFIVKSHITMKTAFEKSPNTACGFAFRTIGDYAQVGFVGQNGNSSFISFDTLWKQGYFGNVSNPEELELVLIVFEKKIWSFINGKAVLSYEHSLDPHAGGFGYAIMSGSDQGFGSQCDFKNTDLWVIKNN